MTRDLLRPPDAELRPAPEGLDRCLQCGELYGWALFTDPPRHVTASPGYAGCLCEGIVCQYCRKGAIRRPISDRYDELTGRLWHTAYFGYMTSCEDCKRAGLEARP